VEEAIGSRKARPMRARRNSAILATKTADHDPPYGPATRSMWKEFDMTRLRSKPIRTKRIYEACAHGNEGAYGARRRIRLKAIGGRA